VEGKSKKKEEEEEEARAPKLFYRFSSFSQFEPKQHFWLLLLLN
jgi:hypothetical protein